MKIILASKSGVRKNILDKNGFEIYDFDPAKDMDRVGELI